MKKIRHFHAYFKQKLCIFKCHGKYLLSNLDTNGNLNVIICFVCTGTLQHHVAELLCQAITTQIAHIICVCVCVCAHVQHVWLAVLSGILAFPSWWAFFYSSRRPWLHYYINAVFEMKTPFLLEAFIIILWFNHMDSTGLCEGRGSVQIWVFKEIF